MGFTKALARWIVDLRFEDLPAAVVPWTKAAVTDYFAVGLAGCPAPGLKIVRKHVWSQYAKGPSRIIGDTECMSAEAAALFNGTMAHWEEYDDATYGMAGHPSVVTMPALFAAADMEKFSGCEFITAYVAAVEVCAKMGRLITPQTIVLGYHPTAIIGTLGAVAAVGKVWKFDADMMENALGLAATHSCGLRPQMGRMAKPLHAGLAARGGIAAAMLARDGFVGAPDVLEDPHGYVHAFSGGKPGDYDAQAAKLGKPLEILDPGLAFKIFPSNFHTQAGVVAVLTMMREDGVKAADVDSVLCLTNHMTKHSLWNDNPQTGLEGKLSLHYCVAAALVDGQLEVEQFYEDRAQDPAVRALIKRVTLEPHPAMANLDFTKGKDFLGMEVIIKLKNGKTVSRHIKSGFSVPGVDGDKVHDELNDKLVRNARRVLPQANIDECLARIARLETVEAAAELQAPLCHRKA